ncbi:hypothetical protein [Mesorhizobium sp. DCY119]|uniref:hypothetical protein n=1 Tax=Mesorhizobium sp. DCY119 TaxID=2108445 RepID=UPI001A9035AE|nr:hypothetical protein [Mesorhizobium sp. DCY119]
MFPFFVPMVTFEQRVLVPASIISGARTSESQTSQGSAAAESTHPTPSGDFALHSPAAPKGVAGFFAFEPMTALFVLNLAVVEVEYAVTRLMNEISLKVSPGANVAMACAAMDRSVLTGVFRDIQADCSADFAVEFVIEKSARHLSTILP